MTNKHFYTILGILIFIVSIHSPCLAQVKFRQFTTEAGLSHNNIQYLFQDSYGFIWIATNHGLNRFDGYEFKKFYSKKENTQSLPSNDVTLIWEDSLRHIWVANNYDGISRFHRKTETFEHFFKGKIIDAIYQESSSTVLLGIGERQGLWRFNMLTGKSEQLINQKDVSTCIPHFYIEKVLKDKQGQIWMGGGSLFKYNKNQDSLQCFQHNANNSNSLTHNYVSSLFKDSKGRIWVGTKTGLNLWKPEEQHFQQIFPTDYLPLKDKELNYISYFEEDDKGNLWLGTTAGLLYFDIKAMTFQAHIHQKGQPSSLSQGGVVHLLLDQTQTLWIGTTNGLNVLYPTAKQFDKGGYNQLLLGIDEVQNVRDFLKIDSNQYCLAHTKGLYKIARQDGTFKTKQISKESTFRLYQGKNDDLYASVIADGFLQVRSDKMIQRFKMAKDYSGELPIGNPIYDFAEDVSGKLWVIANGELNRYDTLSKRFLYYTQARHKISQQTELNRVWDTHIDAHEDMWLASRNGLFFLSQEELQKDFGTPLDYKTYYYDKNDAHSMSNNVTTCLLETQDGTIWVGTESGFNRFDNGQFIRYLEEGTNNFIMSMVEDNQGNLWLGTNNGLIHFNTTTEALKAYTTEDGLMTNAFTWRTTFKEEDGLMVFVTKEGIISFYPDSLSSNTIVPPVYITDFKLFNKKVNVGTKDSLLKEPVHLTEQITLDYQQNVLTFQFSALNFFNSDANEYAYQLVGFDDTLQYVGTRREATFTNLNPGDYTLWVQASNNDDIWNETGTKLHINILPPWWKTWWAYSCWSILFLGILYSLYQFQLSRQLARLEANRLKELDVFKTNLYTNITHEFRTPLTIILGMAKQIRNNPLEQLEKGLNMIQRNGQDLLNLVNQMLSLSKLESGNLEVQQVQGDFILYIQYLVESFQSLAASKSITLHFISKKESLIMAYDAKKIKSILSNLLSNAIKFTPEKGDIYIEINQISVEKISLSVRDTGLGIKKNKIDQVFQRFYQIDDSSTRTGEGTGIGLALTKGLVELLEGTIEVESQIGVGTSFKITLPVHSTTGLAVHSDFTTKEYKPTTSTKSIPAAPSKANLPMVLLVEDNEDVVAYLSTCLEGQYDLKIARNGQEGIEKALELIPDLIISDVMMPEKDGFELCEHLKTDTRSSHIPIILLTAKADIQSRIAGLRFGADDYLAKPFHEEELKIRIENLLKIREQLRTYYTSADFLNSKTSETNASAAAYSVQEEQFLKQVILHIEQLIDQADLTAEKLADLMFMSYANLYRKLKALTGMNVGEYIRHIRLQKAAILLKESPELSISQVALDVGFVTLAHFSRAFKKVYGLSPSKFRKL